MKFWKKVFSSILIFACLGVSVGPFLVPVSALEGLVTEKDLADPESKFVEVNHVTVHYKEMGQGKTTFILLHGFGASVYSWHEVTDDFASLGRVIAYDRPAFGLTERPMPGDWLENPYGMKANIELLGGLMDALGIEKAVLVGNSAGGGVRNSLCVGISSTGGVAHFGGPRPGRRTRSTIPRMGLAADAQSANETCRSPACP